MICPKCGKNNIDGVLFCPYCCTSLKTNEFDIRLKISSSDADNICLIEDVTPVENVYFHVSNQQSSNDLQNKKPSRHKKLSVIGFTILMMAIALGTVFLFHIGTVEHSTVTENDIVNANFESAESTIENTAERAPSESFEGDLLYGNTPKSSEPIQPKVDKKETIGIYGGVKATTEDFIFPYSSKAILTDEELAGLESDDEQTMHSESQMAINEIFARYGYTFGSTTETASAAKERFEALDWYAQVKKICPSDSWWTLQTKYMNEIEVQNIEKLIDWQKEHGVYY